MPQQWHRRPNGQFPVMRSFLGNPSNEHYVRIIAHHNSLGLKQEKQQSNMVVKSIRLCSCRVQTLKKWHSVPKLNSSFANK